MKRTGIYKIQSKIKPERIYIGSAISIIDRWNIHKSDFIRSRRHSQQFQRHYDKYGVDDLIFTIVEEFEFKTKEHLLAREQYYIDYYNPYFNGCKIAGSPLGFKHSIETKEKKRKWCIENNHKPPSTKGLKWSESTGKKHSEINKLLGIVPPNRKGCKWSLGSIIKRRIKRRREKIRNIINNAA
jgi:group I intron endonuclease